MTNAYLPHNRSVLRRFLRSLTSPAILMLLIWSFSCDSHNRRSPNVEIDGEGSWYHGTADEKQYLLNTFQVNTKKRIYWPPEELARYVDISIDVTGSGFSNRILYRGKEIPWAEYSVHKFSDYLIRQHILLPGDRITLRVFGSNPKKRQISQDQSWDIINPPLEIELESTIYTNRYNDRHLKVVSPSRNYGEYERSTVSQIQDWSLDKIRKDIYTKSPLLHHIANVKRDSDSKTVKRLLIFVTDGHIDFDDVYFSPADYSERTMSYIKNATEELKLKPFASPDPNVSVVIFGLNYAGDERFRQTQEALLRWFLDKQDPRFVTLIAN